MNTYQETYIQLKKNYEEKRELNPLFDFRTELEQSADEEARLVLVDVYTLLKQYRTAYHLLLQLISPDDQKNKKRIATLWKQSQDYGDYYAIKQLDKLDQDERLKKIPQFRYHPNPFLTDVFEELRQAETCDCCKKPTRIKYKSPLYSVETVTCLCPECIADGQAAETFNGEFQDPYSVDKIQDPDGEKLDTLIHKTPGYHGWQQEYWRAHCNDYCAMLCYVGAQELEDWGILEEVLDDPMWDDEQKDLIRGHLRDGGSFQGYLFRCLHCGRYLLWADCD